MERRIVNLWALISPAESIPGQWIAHCLDYDIVSQGNSPGHALEMLSEAIEICLADDFQSKSPVLRNPAPAEEWKHLDQILSEGSKVPLQAIVDAPASGKFTWAVPMRMDSLKIERVEPMAVMHQSAA